MTGCSALNCPSRTENTGFKFHRFPSNEERKKKWTENIGRSNWVPSDTSRLCGKHFEDSQYENNRADGRRKLKPNAVPTLFDFQPKKFKKALPPGGKRIIKIVNSDTNFKSKRHFVSSLDELANLPCKEEIKTEEDHSNPTRADIMAENENLKIKNHELVLQLAGANAAIKILKKENKKLQEQLDMLPS